MKNKNIDKPIYEIYKRLVKRESDVTLLKNLLDAKTFENSFIDVCKTEILTRSKN